MKRKTYASLKRKLDVLFSRYIRRRWADKAGNVRCVSCRAVLPGEKMQAGHFVSRVHLATRWDTLNCAPQCSSCNVLRRGNLAEYAAWLQREYGVGIIERLVQKKRERVKYTRSDLEILIAEYQGKLDSL